MLTVTSYFSQDHPYGQGICTLLIADINGQTFLYSLSQATQGLRAFRLTQNGTITALNEVALPAVSSAGFTPVIVLTQFGGQDYLISNTSGIPTAQLSDTGLPNTPFSLQPTGSTPYSSLISTTIGSDDYLFAVRQDNGAIIGWSPETSSSMVPDFQSATQQRKITDLEHISDFNTPYLVAVVANQNTLISYRIAPENGTLTEVDRIGVQQGFAINTPLQISQVQIGNQTFLCLISAETDSLSVLAVSGLGKFYIRDHVLDTLATRFANPQALATVEFNERAYIVVGGSDAGLTLFQLLPNGQLILETSLSDTATSGLQNITSLTAMSDGDTIRVFASGSAESGITELRITPTASGAALTGTMGADSLAGTNGDDLLWGDHGDDTLTGGDGKDILLDGGGRDTLIGGRGEDLFVLTPDGETDIILDFNPLIDKIDLSAFGMLYDRQQLSISQTATGAEISFRSEILLITSHIAAPILLDRLTNETLLNFPRPYLERETPPNIIEGDAFENILFGTPANDNVFAYQSNDSVYAGNGADMVFGGAGHDLLRGQMGNDHIEGGDGNDLLLGGNGADFISGGSGWDRIFGEVGNDTLIGNAGEDRIGGGLGHDTLFGGDGADSLSGGAAKDNLYGGKDNDQLDGGTGNDRLFGEDGNDRLLGGWGADTLYGGAGGDTLFGNLANDRLYGGAGEDTLYGGIEDDLLWGQQNADLLIAGRGNDTLNGGDGNDRLFGEIDADLLFGGNGADRLFGGDQPDTLHGDAGADDLFGGKGSDQLYGGTGADRLHGGAGNDVLSGGDGDDYLEGGNDNDQIVGGNGNDQIIGQIGADTLDGGAGLNTLTGGQGADRFVFMTAGATATITDFDSQVDTLAINQNLWATPPQTPKTAADHATISGDDIVFDFYGETQIRLLGAADQLATLQDALLLL